MAPDRDIQTLGEILIRAAENPGRGITYFPEFDGPTQFQSYAQLLAEAKVRLAGLRAHGLKPGSRVLLQLSDNRDILTSFWACILGGFPPLIGPLAGSYDEPNHVLERLKRSHQLMENPFVLTRAELAPAVGLLAPSKDPILVLESLAGDVENGEPHFSHDEEAAFYVLSSGSGGKTKCAVLTHRGLIAAQRGANVHCGHRSDDVIFNWLPFDHVGAITDWHLRPMLLGCSVAYAPKETILSSPLNWLDRLHELRATHSWAPNFAYMALNRGLGSKPVDPRRWDLSQVRFLLNIGEPVAYQVFQELSQKLAPCGLRPSALRAAWGMTELSGGTVYFIPTQEGLPLRHRVSRASIASSFVEDAADDDADALSLLDLGRPIPQVALRVLDPEGRQLPERRVGRVEVSGPTCFAGYLNDPESTRAVMSPDGWFDTGDMGFISDGSLVLAGREKAILIVNGQKFFGNDLEAAAETVKGLKPASTAACTVTDPGESQEKMAIFFVAEDSAQIKSLALAVSERITREMGVTPDCLIALQCEEIPRTAIGKIVRHDLVGRYQRGELAHRVLRLEDLREPAPPSVGDEVPLSPLEISLGKLWRELLQCGPVRRQDDFFRLGGSSLLATRLLGRLRSLFRVELSMRSIFQASTLEAMAGAIRAGETQPGMTDKIAALLTKIDGTPASENRRAHAL